MDKVNPALEALPKNLDQVLEDEEKKMKDTGDKAKEDLDKRIKELDDLGKKNDALLNKMGNNAPFSPEDVEEAQAGRDQFRDIAGKALEDISPEKNVNVLGDEKGDNLRKDLDQKANGPVVVPTPDNAKVI